jgi:hypothetical protein
MIGSLAPDAVASPHTTTPSELISNLLVHRNTMIRYHRPIMTAATVLQKHTYILGRSLYIPLTCRCNSITLPVSRGPRFLLPKSITDALVSVRHAECGGQLIVGDDEERQPLPDYPKKWLVNCLYDDVSESSSTLSESTYDGKYVLDDRISPSISTLTNEAISYLSDNSNESFEVVIAGEGEPTLRMDALLSISHKLQSHRYPYG